MNPTPCRVERILVDSPAIDIALVNEPGELALGEHSVVEVEPGVLPDVGLAQTQRLDHPVELVVAIVVLCCAQRMSHALHTVNDGAGKVVRGVHPGGGVERGLSHYFGKDDASILSPCMCTFVSGCTGYTIFTRREPRVIPVFPLHSFSSGGQAKIFSVTLK